VSHGHELRHEVTHERVFVEGDRADDVVGLCRAHEVRKGWLAVALHRNEVFKFLRMRSVTGDHQLVARVRSDERQGMQDDTVRVRRG